MDVHMDRAEKYIYVFYATAVLALGALALARKSPKAFRALALCAAAAGMLSLGIGGWIARAGGQVSHPEFRTGGPPPAEHHS